MPQKGDTQINNFVGGLITEASPLSFPENASLDEINFKLNRDGTRWRRLGVDFEDDYQLNDTGFTDEAMARSRQRFFRWPSPSGNVDIEIGVVQIGGALYFADLFTENPSANLLNSGTAVDSGLRGNVVLDFTIINNDLLVLGEAISIPFILSYDADTDTITKTDSAVKIRDLYGVSDGIGVGVRPTSLTNNHEYNLRNQGWSDDIVTTCGNPVLQCTFDTLGKYPSNSDTWSLGKIADVTDADIDKYDPDTLLKNSFDIGQAPKGRFIIDLYDRGNSRAVESGITVSAIDRELGLLSVSEAYAGRMFYSGIKSKIEGGDDRSVNMSAAVLFSQIVRNKDDMHKCYQQADPTSPTDSDVVDTDGGIVFVSGAVNIVKLLATKTSLFVFAENGIWEIRGDEGGFRATSFQVNKVSSIGVFSAESIVEANGTIFFWAKEGIFAISPNQLGDAYDSTNLTITTIQRHYNSLPNLVKQAAKGYYDAANNSIRWLFASDEVKVVGEPIEIQPPIEATILGTPVPITDRQQPLLAKASATTAFVLYRNSGVSQMYYRIATIASDNTVTLGAEGTVKASSIITSMATIGLTDNRILVVYRDVASGTTTNAMVGTVSGDSVTFGTPVSLGTTHGGDLTRGLFELRKISDTRVLFGSNNTTNSRPNLQVIDVSSSDVITPGTIATSTAVNRTSVKIAIFSAADGVVATGGSSVNTLASVEYYSIAGSSVTFNGTSYSFTNSTQNPGVSHQFFIGDVVETSGNTAFLHGGATVDGGHGWASMTLTNTTGTITSTTVLTEDNFTSSPTASRADVVFHNNQLITLGTDQTVSPNTIALGVYKNSATPVKTLTNTLATDSGLNHPNGLSLGTNQVVQGWTQTTGATPAVQIVAHTIL